MNTMNRMNRGVSVGVAAMGLALGLMVAGFAASPARGQKVADVKSDALFKDVFVKSVAGPVLSPLGARHTAKKGDTITITGRVGGAKDPFVPGRAVLTLVGEELPACNENPDDRCAIPWDYCCETPKDIVRHSVTVQVVDAKGRVIRADLKGRNGIAELSELTVVGKVIQADDKAFIVNATSLAVNPALPTGLFVKEAAAGAVEPAAAKVDAKVGDVVTLRGRIGGGLEPFVSGQAVFTIVGAVLQPCSATEGDTCETPWDYCCDSKEAILANSASVQVANVDGVPLRTELKGRRGLKEITEVVVTGKVASIEGGGLVLNATSIAVAP